MKDFDKEIEKIVEQLKPLYEQQEALNKKITALQKKRKTLREDKEKAQLQTSMTKEQEIEYFLFEDGFVDGERYKARQKYWNDKGLWESGYFSEIQQVNLNLMLYKGDTANLEKTIKNVEEVLPFLKPLNGKKRLGIFEHTLSENGNWTVEIDDESFDLVLHHYHRRSVEKQFKTLRELIEYIQENHYYSDGDDD